MFAHVKHCTAMANNQRRETVQSLERGLEILKVFSTSSEPMGITDISRNLGLAKGSVSRLVKTFVEHGFLQQNQETSKYQLGMGIWELASKVNSGRNITEVARPVLRKLHSQIEETVHLSILNEDNKMVFLEKIESNKDVRPNVQLGANLPPYCVANGKAMLAYRPAVEVKWILRGKLQKYTDKTISSSSTITKNLEQVRQLGYSTNYGEFRADVAGIAAPICDYTGRSVAALGVSVPTSRFTDELINSIALAVVESAKEISMALGLSVEGSSFVNDEMNKAKKTVNKNTH